MIEPEMNRTHLPGRVFQTLVSPARVMRDLRHDPRTIGVLLLGGALIGIGNAAIPADIWEQVIRNQVLAAGGELPANLETSAEIAKWVGTTGMVIFWPILGILVAAIYSFVFIVGLGYDGRYPQYLSVTAHALIVAAIGTLALTPLRILTGDVQLTLTMGAFLPILEDGFLARFLRYLDLFYLWVSGLIGLGASIIDGTRRAGVSIAFALGTSVLVAVLLATLIA